IALLALLRHSRSPSVLKALVSGLAISLLPACGGNGLVLAPFLALWLAGTSWLAFRHTPRRMGAALASLFGALCTLSFVAFYLHGYHRPPHTGPSNILSIVPTAAQFLAGGMGF